MITILLPVYANFCKLKKITNVNVNFAVWNHWQSAIAVLFQGLGNVLDVLQCEATLRPLMDLCHFVQVTRVRWDHSCRLWVAILKRVPKKCSFFKLCAHGLILLYMPHWRLVHKWERVATVKVALWTAVHAHSHKSTHWWCPLCDHYLQCDTSYSHLLSIHSICFAASIDVAEEVSAYPRRMLFKDCFG